MYYFSEESLAEGADPDLDLLCVSASFFQHFCEEVPGLVVEHHEDRGNDFVLEEAEIKVQRRSWVLVASLVSVVFNEPSLVTRANDATHVGSVPHK